jgi:hypothetical protein
VSLLSKQTTQPPTHTHTHPTENILATTGWIYPQFKTLTEGKSSLQSLEIKMTSNGRKPIKDIIAISQQPQVESELNLKIKLSGANSRLLNLECKTTSNQRQSPVGSYPNFKLEL